MAKAAFTEAVGFLDPLPDKRTCCGLPVLLSLMERLALRGPDAVGLNVTVMVQEFPALTLVPQVVVREKSPCSVPVIVMLVMLSVVFPVLVSVVAWGELEWPICTVPKLRLAGTSLTVPTVIVIDEPTAAFVSATGVAMIATLGSDGTVVGAV